MANWPCFSVEVATKDKDDEVIDFVLGLAHFDEYNKSELVNYGDTYIVKATGVTPWLNTLKPLCDMIQGSERSADLYQGCGMFGVKQTFKWRRGKCIYQELLDLPDIMLEEEARIKGIEIPSEIPTLLIGENISPIEEQVKKYYEDTKDMSDDELEKYNEKMDIEFEKALEKVVVKIENEKPYAAICDEISKVPFPEENQDEDDYKEEDISCDDPTYWDDLPF